MFVYLITNTVNGKIYVGKTTKSVDERWTRHCSYASHGSSMRIHRAIRKYGKEIFRIEIIDSVKSEQELNKLECFYISKFRSSEPNIGYNMTLGGDGGSLSAAQKLSKSIAAKARMTPELREKIGKAVKESFTAEIRQKLRDGARLRMTPELKQKISDGMRGTITPDVIARRIATTKSRGGFSHPKTHCLRGHPFDDENTLIDRRGGRVCRACHRLYARTRRNGEKL